MFILPAFAGACEPPDAFIIGHNLAMRNKKNGKSNMKNDDLA